MNRPTPTFLGILCASLFLVLTSAAESSPDTPPDTPRPQSETLAPNQDGQAEESTLPNEDEQPNEDALLRSVAHKIEGDDLEGAIGDLEDLHFAGQASPKALAILGALYNEIGLYGDALDVLRPLAEQPDANPAVLYNAGRAALEQAASGDGAGDISVGETFLRRSVTMQPLSPAARLLGLRLGSRGQTQIAYQLLRPWALANPDDHEGRLAAAAAASRLQRVDEAHELLQGLPEETPSFRLLAADLALQRRQPDRAVEWLTPLVEDAPPEMLVDVLVLLASAHLELGQSSQAISLLTDRAAQHPRLALYLARAHYQNGEIDLALKQLEPLVQPIMAVEMEAIPASSRDVAAAITLQAGRVLVATDRAKEAVPLLERASQIEPWNREVWQELARAYAANQQDDQATQAMAKFQQLAQAKERAAVPGLQGKQRLEDTIAKRLAEALEWQERGEGDQALSIVRQEISLAPEDLRPRLLEIRLLLAQGHSVQALLAADAAIEAFPKRPDPLHFRAIARLNGGDVTAAEKDLRQALTIAPAYIPAKNDLAYLFMGTGRRDRARALLQEILASHPEDALAKQRMQQLEQSETP